MSDVKISFEIDGVEYSIDQLEQLGKEAKTSGDNLETMGKDGKKATDELSKGSKKAGKESGFLNDKLKGVRDFTSKLRGDAANLTKGFQGWAQSMGLGAKASRGLAVSLAALGLPLIILAITALIDYFKNFEPGVKLVAQSMAALSVVMEGVIDAFVALITLDFSGFIDAVGGIGDAVSDVIEDTNRLFEIEAKLSELTQNQTERNAELTAELRLQERAVRDTTLTFDERREAMEKITAIEEELLENERERIALEVEQLEIQIKNARGYKEERELKEQLAQVNASLIKTESDLAIVRDKGERQLRMINQEESKLEEDRTKKSREQAAERQKIAEDAAQKKLDIERNYQQQLDQLLNDNFLKQLQDDDVRAEQSLIIQRQADIDKLKQTEMSAEQRRSLEMEINRKYDILDQERIAEKEARELEQLEKQEQLKMEMRDELYILEAQTEQERFERELEVEKERREVALETEMEQRLADLEGLENFEELKLEIEQSYHLKRLELETEFGEKSQDFKDKLEKADQERREREIKASMDTVGAIGNSLQMAAGLAEDNSRGQKALASAGALINTLLAATQALALPLPPPLPQIQAGLITAVGMKSVAEINKTEVPSFARGGSVMGASHAQGGIMAELERDEFVINSAAMQVPGVRNLASQMNAMAQPSNERATQIDRPDVGGMSQAPMKAYVVAQEVTDEQEIENKIKRLSRL